MHFHFCPDCGASLTERTLGDEPDVPWCDRCNKPWFDVFPVAVIVLVHDQNANVLLLRQSYISTVYANLVSGYVKPGETCEQCAIREVLEETGQQVHSLTPVLTNWFERKQMMMVGYIASVCPRELKLSIEVDSAQWTPAHKALEQLHTSPTSTSRMLAEHFITLLSHNNLAS